MADHKIDGNGVAGNVQAPDRIWLTTTESGKVDDWTQWLDDQDQLHPKAPRTEYIRSDRFSYQVDAANARTEYWKAKYDAAVADRDAAWCEGRDAAASAAHKARNLTLGQLTAVGCLTPPPEA